MPAEGRENPLLKKGNSDAFFREKYLTKNTMKIEDVDIYDLPIWACAVVDEIDETCRKRLKESPEYSRILKESDELLLKYPFISKIIDRDEINEPIELSVEKARALSQFLALDADREDYERIQLYLMGCQYTLGVLQLLEIL